MKTLHAILTTVIKVIEVTPPMWEIDLFSLDSLQKETFQLSYSQIRGRFWFNVCDGIQVSYYDWWATVVKWLFIHFSFHFLVLPVKKIDMSVKYKGQLNLTHHKQRATKLTCFVLHRDSHLIYKRYKVQKKNFNGHSRCTSINVHKTHTVFVFFFFFFFFFTQNTHIFFLFQWPSKVHMYQCTQNTHFFFVFFMVPYLAMLISIYITKLE